MGRQDVEQIRAELSRLMTEQIASLQSRTFLGLDKEELRREEERLKRIRELSADFLAALKEDNRLVD
jgi:hypothetical protein